MIKNKIILFTCVFLLAGCGARATLNNEIPVSKDSNKHVLVKKYLVGVDDQVQVNVWKHSDLSITVPVRPDGMISVPLIGEVLAGGRTPVDIAAEIEQRLAKYIKQPNVAVILAQLNSHEYLSRVRVTGAISTPSSMTYRQGMTVLDIVLDAGGLTDFASGNSAKLFRRIDGNMHTIDVDINDILDDGDMTTNYQMEPGDILSVPERMF